MKMLTRLQVILGVACFGLFFLWLYSNSAIQAGSSVATPEPFVTVIQPTALAGSCFEAIPASGEIFIEGVVGRPHYINPLLADSNPVDVDLVDLIFDGLTRYDTNGELVGDLAEFWQVSEDGLTVTFSLRDGVRWHDGEPVTTEDVAFTYSLLQDDAFPALAGVKALWQSVTINVIDERRIAFTLPTPYAPFLDATTRGILPAHRLGGVNAGNITDQPYNQAPIGTGLFIIDSGEWEQTGRLYLLPNPDYWLNMPRMAAVEMRFFANEPNLIAAFEAGEIHAMNRLSPAEMPAIATLPNARLFSAPANRLAQLLINQTDSGFAPLKDVEIRTALAYSLDRPELINVSRNGQGLSIGGPYLPSSWAYNPQISVSRPYRPISATTTLEEAGWLIPFDENNNATSLFRQDEAGEPFSLRLLYVDSPEQSALAATIMSQWETLGIGTELRPVPISDFLSSLSAREYDIALVELTPLGDPDLYDFWSQEAIFRGQNYGGWNNRRASEALENARQIWDVSLRKDEYNRFLVYFRQEVPAISLYQHTYTYALSTQVESAEIGFVRSPRERFDEFENWFLTYVDVPVSCRQSS
jgi:peptide/nickel transport system substrate-binding protein